MRKPQAAERRDLTVSAQSCDPLWTRDMVVHDHFMRMLPPYQERKQLEVPKAKSRSKSKSQDRGRGKRDVNAPPLQKGHTHPEGPNGHSGARATSGDGVNTFGVHVMQDRDTWREPRTSYSKKACSEHEKTSIGSIGSTVASTRDGDGYRAWSHGTTRPGPPPPPPAAPDFQTGNLGRFGANLVGPQGHRASLPRRAPPRPTQRQRPHSVPLGGQPKLTNPRQTVRLETSRNDAKDHTKGQMAAGDKFLTDLGEFFQALAARNPTGGRLTRFHAVRPPVIGIKEYLLRVGKYFECSTECFVLALIYIDRLVARHTDFLLTQYNIHRVLVTSVLLAVKFFDDVYYSNNFYAKVGGVQTKELNILEVQMLQLIDWRLSVTPTEFIEFRNGITSLGLERRETSGTKALPLSRGNPVGADHKLYRLCDMERYERQLNEPVDELNRTRARAA